MTNQSTIDKLIEMRLTAMADAMYVLPQPVAPVIKRFRCSDIYSQVASLFIRSLFNLRPEV